MGLDENKRAEPMIVREAPATIGPDEKVDLSILRDDKRILRASGEAVYAALQHHKQIGNPIAVWRDGKVVMVPPEEIPDDPAVYGLEPSK